MGIMDIVNSIDDFRAVLLAHMVGCGGDLAYKGSLSQAIDKWLGDNNTYAWAIRNNMTFEQMCQTTLDALNRVHPPE